MELRQLRYFVRVVELGSMARAAADLGVVRSALSQQLARLESELGRRLLDRNPKGMTPNAAGLALFAEAQLALRHVEQAARVVNSSRLTGTVSVAMPPSTIGVLGLPLLMAMRKRYPDVRVHLVESDRITGLLNSRQIDLAVLFHSQVGRGLTSTPLLEERLFLLRAAHRSRRGAPAHVRLADLAR